MLKPMIQAKDLRAGLQQGFWRTEWTSREALHYERLNTSRFAYLVVLPTGRLPSTDLVMTGCHRAWRNEKSFSLLVWRNNATRT